MLINIRKIRDLILTKINVYRIRFQVKTNSFSNQNNSFKNYQYQNNLRPPPTYFECEILKEFPDIKILKESSRYLGLQRRIVKKQDTYTH